MNKTELIKSMESSPSSIEERAETTEALTKSEVEEICGGRVGQLESIRSLISLKFFHQISEKLEKEKRQFAELLKWHDTAQDILANYSFALNPSYFEQKFFY
jgi:hypothetical protein